MEQKGNNILAVNQKHLANQQGHDLCNARPVGVSVVLPLNTYFWILDIYR